MSPLARLPSDPTRWGPYVDTLDAAARRSLGEAVTREWIEGRLEARFGGRAATGAVSTLRKQLTRLIEGCGRPEDFAVEWGGIAVDESAVRRWCWIEPWRLLSQDEDLLLMEDHRVIPLLEEAAAGCTKRDYVLQIVEHHVRDRVHASLRTGPDGVRDGIRELLAFRPAAIDARCHSLEAYLNRLEAHARPRKVAREEARAVISDVWRCRAPETVVLEPESAGEWRAKYDDRSWIVVDRKTGSLRLKSRREE